MKSYSEPRHSAKGRWAVSLAVMGMMAFLGCETRYPTSSLPLEQVLSTTRVLDFEGTGAAVTTVNPNLAEAGVPGQVIQRPGYASLTGGGTAMAVVAPGANGTGHALSVSGTLTAARLQWIVKLDTLSPSGYYNARLFTGIRFYQKVSATDNTSPKFFSMPTAQTMPPPEGTCVQPGCYNHFGANYASTDGNWELVTLDFSSFTRGTWGDAVDPPTFSGPHLEQVVQLQWQEDNGESATGGVRNADFAIDEIAFY